MECFFNWKGYKILIVFFKGFNLFLLGIFFNYKYFWNYLEDFLFFGRFFFIEDVGEELDFVLDNVFEKNFIKFGFMYKVWKFFCVEKIIWIGKENLVRWDMF